MSSAREPIGVIGTGYVGLVTAAGFAELGSDVYCIDIDADKVARLQAGEVPIYEPGLDDVLARNRGRLHFSTDIADALEHARLLFVAVGTPPTYSGDADLSAVHAVVDAMPASDGHALVMKSTVPVGTGRNIKRLFGERGKGGFRYVSCPEFLKEGSAVADFLAPDRVVVGDDGDWAGDAVVDLYRPLLGAAHGGSGPGELVRSDIASAEMVKLASNAFLATKISFINEIANVCEETGADVIEVAKGMGLDDRIGPKFLNAGVGFGGSCFPGDETVLVRHRGHVQLIAFRDLWRRLEREADDGDGDDVLAPDGLEVLSWPPEGGEPHFARVSLATRRRHEGDLVHLRTKMGRRVACTPDHPFYVGDGRGAPPEIKLAGELTERDWLPVARGLGEHPDAPDLLPTALAVDSAALSASEVIVRPQPGELARVAAGTPAQRRAGLPHARGTSQRWSEIRRTGSLRLDEAGRLALDARGASYRTASNGAELPDAIVADEMFWRVVGLYLAEGCTSQVGRNAARVIWSFHPTREQHLVDEVVAFWTRHGVRCRARRSATSSQVIVQSRLVAAWWTGVLGLGRTSYEQRLPDLVWTQGEERKWALLSGLWEGDGSWSLVGGGPSVVLEYGTVSRALADGVHRLLGDLGVVASMRVGRATKSTRDTYWLRVSGADQVEAALALVPARDRAGVLASSAHQAKRIAPTGYRRERDTTWVRIVSTERHPFDGDVYSLEVPEHHTFVTTFGLVAHNCFPKDVSALKQLAGNSGYHFQLLNAVIEVNELQKRRVMGKLEKHLGTLVGKRVALLGLAFKPNTDDMREATSLVLSARLQAAGAEVSAFDPIAEAEARKLIRGVRFADSAQAAIADADAVVLVTEWAQFRELDWPTVATAMRGSLVVDGRNALDAAAVTGAGLTYEGIGRGGI